MLLPEVNPMKRLTSSFAPCMSVTRTDIGIDPRDGITAARRF
jgi:hypothetical protein